MKSITDDDLVLMYLEGDTEAFNALFDRYYGAVYNFAKTMLRDVQQAEDALQDVFVAVVRALPSYRPSGRFRYWLMRIARNRCLNRIESQRALRVLANDELLEVTPAISEDPTPDATADASDTRAVVLKAIGRLPDRQREAITLYTFEQMRYADIADVLEMPLNTVKTLIHRARARLADELDAFRKERAS